MLRRVGSMILLILPWVIVSNILIEDGDLVTLAMTSDRVECAHASRNLLSMTPWFRHPRPSTYDISFYYLYTIIYIIYITIHNIFSDKYKSAVNDNGVYKNGVPELKEHHSNIYTLPNH